MVWDIPGTVPSPPADEAEFIEFTDADEERLEQPTLFSGLLGGLKVEILKAQVRGLEAQIENQRGLRRTERKIGALLCLFSFVAGLVTAALLF